MTGLSDNARRALDRAEKQRRSYAVRVVRAPDGRLVAILGETHMKLAKASQIGRDVVESFDLRGVETLQSKQVFLGRTLGVFIQAPRTLLQALSLGRIKGSTITDAKRLASGVTVELERAQRMPFGLHVASGYLTAFYAVYFLVVLGLLVWPWAPPAIARAIPGGIIALVVLEVHLLALIPGIRLRRHAWSWIVHPFLGLLTPRDGLMAAGTERMLQDHPAAKEAVVVMGRAHVPGYEQFLVEQYGFRRVGS